MDLFLYDRNFHHERVNCVCLKSKTLCNCLPSSSFLHFFSGITGNSKVEFGAIKYFTDYWTAKTIQLFVAMSENFFLVYSFSEYVAAKGNSKDILDRCSHQFICIVLKQTWNNGLKPVKAVKILVSEQIALAAIFLLWTSFCFLKVNPQKYVGMVSTNNM